MADKVEATEPTFKVFVGNLNYKTTEDTLREAFSKSGGVVDVAIIRQYHNGRPLGYGFVMFATDADAQNAVAQMDKVEIDERPINVERAKVRNENEPREPRGRRGRGRGRGRGGRRGGGDRADATGGVTVAVTTNGDANNGEAPAAAAGGRPRGRGRGGRGGRGGSRRRQQSEGDDLPTAASVPGFVLVEHSDAPLGADGEVRRGGRRGRGRGPRRGRGRRNPGEQGEGHLDQAMAPAPVAAAAGGEDGAAKRPRRRPTRRPRPPTDGVPRPLSKTTVYVANIPFTLTDDTLKSAFTEHGPVDAKIVRWGPQGRSRGYGFVHFQDEKGQNSALQMNGKEVEGRALSVKIAQEQPVRPPPAQQE